MAHSPQATTDAQLVARTLMGDQHAYALLVDRHRHAVYGLACHLVADLDEAKDLAQESFVRAYERLSELREPSKFAPWMRSITHSVCANWRSKRRTRDASYADEAQAADRTSAEPGPHLAAERAELGRLVRSALDSLSDANRLAVILYHVNGLSCGEIGDFLGISRGAVKGRLHRARQQLREGMPELIRDWLEERPLTDEFTEEVSSMVVGFGVSGNGDSRYAFPDNRSTSLYAALYPEGRIDHALGRCNLTEVEAAELLKRWAELDVISRGNATIKCLAPVLTKPDGEAIAPLGERVGAAWADAVAEHRERYIDIARRAARGEAMDGAVEAAVWWFGSSGVYEALAEVGLLPQAGPGFPKRGDTGEYCLMGWAQGAGAHGKYSSSSPNYGDGETTLSAYTWWSVPSQCDVQKWLQIHSLFPMPHDPPARKLMRILRDLAERPLPRTGLVALARAHGIEEYYPAEDFVGQAIRFRFATPDEPHALAIPYFGKQLSPEVKGLALETGRSVVRRMGDLGRSFAEVASRCSFRNCSPVDSRVLMWNELRSYGIAALVERGLVPDLPGHCYAERGYFLRSDRP